MRGSDKGTVRVYFTNKEVRDFPGVLYLGYTLAHRAHDKGKPVELGWAEAGKHQEISIPARKVNYLEWISD